MRRVGVAGLWHETNTYAARTTDLDDFRAFELRAGDEVFAAHDGAGTVLGGFLRAHDWTLVPVATAGAWPSGRITAPTIAELHSRLAAALQNARPLDGLLLDLHGAMVAEGVDDVEAATLEIVRGVVGEIPVVVVHDLHGNPSPELAARCDALIAYDTYPHVDMAERGIEATVLLRDIFGGARLRTVVRKVPILSSPLTQATDAPPMRDLKVRASELERTPGIRRVSLLPGFPYSDVTRAGFSVVVVYEDGHESDAGAVSGEIADEVERRRQDWVAHRPDAATAVADAVASPIGPTVLVDVGDNVGGGGSGDGTTLLGELLAQDAEGAVVGIADAEVARAAAAAGAGAAIEADVGGKTDDRHGGPVSIRGRVERVTDGAYRASGSWQTGRDFSMGATAVVRVAGVTLVVMERRIPPFHAEQLLSVGIDPAEARIITAKGAIAWRAAYGETAARVIEVDTPGVSPLDPYVLPRTTEPMRL